MSLSSSSSKVIAIYVSVYDLSDQTFHIRRSTTGRQLFDQIVNRLSLNEKWYFGLQFTDKNNLECWLKLDKKILASYEQHFAKNSIIKFKFLVKYFPVNVVHDVIEDVTLNLFFQQIKDLIFNEKIYCSPETCVLLASYAIQAKYGDYGQHLPIRGFLLYESLIPKCIKNQYPYTDTEWNEKIIYLYEAHVGMLKEDAMREYLKFARDLEMYGIEYFEIMNKKGHQLWLGVAFDGLYFYEKDNKLVPKFSFPWKEIKNFSSKDKKFTLKLTDKKTTEFVFYATHEKIASLIFDLCIGNHHIYLFKQKPESDEVRKMREKAEYARKTKLVKLNQERDRIFNEMKGFSAQKEVKQQSDDFDVDEQNLDNFRSSLNVDAKKKENNNFNNNSIDFRENNFNYLISDFYKTIVNLNIQIDEMEFDDLNKEIPVEKKEEVVEAKVESEVKVEPEEAQVVNESENLVEPVEEVKPEVEIKEVENEVVEEPQASDEKPEEPVNLAEIETDFIKTEDDFMPVVDENEKLNEELVKIVNELTMGLKEEDTGEMKEERMDNVSDETQPGISGELNNSLNSEFCQTYDDKAIKNKFEELRKMFEKDKLQDKKTVIDLLYQKNLENKMDKYQTIRNIAKLSTKKRIDQFESM